jgi:hypothetical protein
MSELREFSVKYAMTTSQVGNPSSKMDSSPTLMIFGLLEEVREESALLGIGGFFTNHVFSDKMYRFVAWLDFHEMFSTEMAYEFIEFIPKRSDKTSDVE